MMNDKPESMAAIGTHDRVIELLRDHMNGQLDVVDLAAGQGAFSVMLQEQGHNVTAVDADAENWKVKDIDLLVANLDSEFSDQIISTRQKFDLVVAIEIIEHLENPFRFVRECSKILKKDGLIVLTTPNVESMYSRIVFFMTGRLYSFGSYETVRPAHITPIFRWKLEMILEEAGFEIVTETFEPVVHLSTANFKVRAATFFAKIISPFVSGEKGAEGRIVLARLK